MATKTTAHLPESRDRTHSLGREWVSTRRSARLGMTPRLDRYPNGFLRHPPRILAGPSLAYSRRNVCGSQCSRPGPYQAFRLARSVSGSALTSSPIYVTGDPRLVECAAAVVAPCAGGSLVPYRLGMAGPFDSSGGPPTFSDSHSYHSGHTRDDDA